VSGSVSPNAPGGSPTGSAGEVSTGRKPQDVQHALSRDRRSLTLCAASVAMLTGITRYAETP